MNTGEPTEADVKAVYPLWQMWKGTDRMYHARRTEGAALTVRGEDLQDLMEEIQRAEAHLKESRPEAWQ